MYVSLIALSGVLPEAAATARVVSVVGTEAILRLPHGTR
jgi:hypothetical protein